MNSNPHQHYNLQHPQQQQYISHPISPYPTPPPSTESNCGSRTPGSTGSGNGGMSYLDDSASSIQSSPMQQHAGDHHQRPPSGWNKPHHLHHVSAGGGSSSVVVSSIHGASHNYLQQSFYPSSEPHGGTPQGGSVRPHYAPVTNSSSPCAYYSSEPCGPDYYNQNRSHQSAPPPQFNSFEHGGTKTPRRSCGGPNEEPVSSHMNFFPSGGTHSGFYEPNQGYHYTDFPGQEYSRMNYNNCGGGATGGSAVGDYFTGPSSASRSSTSSCPSYGHHHVSTPLEFHQHSSSPHQSHLQSQPFRRNSMESFSVSDGSDSYKCGHNIGPGVSSGHVKRETVIAPPWEPESGSGSQGQDQVRSEQYFYGGAQYSRHGQPQPHLLTASHRCENVPGHGTLTPPVQPSCSFEGTNSDGHFKKGGVKQRSQSLSYSRNYEQHYRPGTSPYHRHRPADPTKDLVPVVSSSPDLGGQGQGYETVENTRRRFNSDPPGAIGQSMETCQGDAEDDEAGSEDDSDESASGSSSSSSPAASPKSSFTPPSVDSNESDCEDNMSDLDLELELKKEIHSVTTTSDGSQEQKSMGGAEDERMVKEDSCHLDPPSCPSSSNDPAKLFIEEAELSNSSLTLFDSIALNTFDSPGPGDSNSGGRVSDMDPPDNQLTPDEGQREGLSPDDPDRCDLADQASMTGLGSISSQARQGQIRPHSNCSASVAPCEQGQRSWSRSCSPLPKVMKRSFSEADKELVVNTSAISALTLPSAGEIQVPKGWRREIVHENQNTSGIVFYFSPSETKLRSLDEVKNYVTSDGTCKCGLSCPLRLEIAFSFDPKVRNGRSADEEGLGGETGKERRSCCSHQQKRKIPLSEDSPLISSTRDDLGDSADGEEEGRKKKRRTEAIQETTLVVPKVEPKTSSSNLIPSSAAAAITTQAMPPMTFQNVVIPFAQQSPDTTTQTTPQRDMSPASSISSDASAAQNRSTNSTPTGTPGGGVKTSPPMTVNIVAGKGQGSEFAWPTPLVRPQTPPTGSWTTSPNLKKPGGYQHHLISKSPTKRSASPCPNIDVRQIPLEQNQPPPRSMTSTMNPINISITPGASHPLQGQSSSVSLVPIGSSSLHNSMSSSSSTKNTSAPLGTLSVSLGDASGYSISPILSTASVGGGLHFTSIHLPPSTSFPQDFGCGLGMPRLVNSTAPILSTGIQPPAQVPNSITISVVGSESSGRSGSERKTLGSLPKLVQKSSSSSNSSGQTETASEKSPLQRVQDVVDRYHIEGGTEGGAGGGGDSNQNVGPEVPQQTLCSTLIRKEANETPPTSQSLEALTLESKILKIIADAASASGKPIAPPPIVMKQEDGPKISSAVRYGMNINLLPASSAPISLISSNQMTLQSIPQTIFTSNSATVTTTSNSNPNNVPIMTSNSILMGQGGGNLGVNTSNTGISINNGNQLILQQQTDPNNPSLRYPIFQTLQPIFLNPGGGAGSLLIPNGNEPQQFIQIDQNNQANQELIHQGTTMVIDPSGMGMCNAGNLLGPGPKKKKKRLSKKQQQQQAQLQLQQQLLLQQLFNHQQVQQQHVQQAQQQIPLLLPPSFNLGPQGFLQPMNMNMNMNFFPTPTILTLPNLILNPADGTLFIQQAGPQMSTNAQQSPQAQLPPQLKIGPCGSGLSQQSQPCNIVLPRKEILTLTPSPIGGGPVLTTMEPLKSGGGGELGIDDSSRQNATPDSSTNDCQLGMSVGTGTSAAVATPQPTAPLTVSLPLGSSTNLQGSKKGPLKSKVVSSSTATTVHKRILPQKQILPKIDSTTPSVENNN